MISIPTVSYRTVSQSKEKIRRASSVEGFELQSDDDYATDITGPAYGGAGVYIISCRLIEKKTKIKNLVCFCSHRFISYVEFTL
jgi:hypothetical protein